MRFKSLLAGLLLGLTSMVTLTGCCGIAWMETSYPKPSTGGAPPEETLYVTRETKRRCVSDAPIWVAVEVLRDRDQKVVLDRRVTFENLPVGGDIPGADVTWKNTGILSVQLYYTESEKPFERADWKRLALLEYVFDGTKDQYVEVP